MADSNGHNSADGQDAFVDRWRENGYNCFSSGHKFCREVCPVTQVTRNENHTPDSVHGQHHRDGQRPAEHRGRGRRLRALRAVRRMRDPLPQHSFRRRLLPGAHRDGQGGARGPRPHGRQGSRPRRLEAVDPADQGAARTSRCWAPPTRANRRARRTSAPGPRAWTYRSAARPSCSSTARRRSTGRRTPAPPPRCCRRPASSSV